MNRRTTITVPLLFIFALACGDDETALDADLVMDVSVRDTAADTRFAQDAPQDVDVRQDASHDTDTPFDAGVNVYFVAPDGDDANDGRSEGSSLRTVEEALERGAAGSHINTPTIRLAPGDYPHQGQLTLDSPVILEGAGRDESIIRLELSRDDAGIRVLSPNVTIRDLEVSVHLVESLSDGIHQGGRGEFGTGITLGVYLTTEEQVAVDGIVLERLRISRPNMAPLINYTAAALTMIGRVQKREGAGHRDVREPLDGTDSPLGGAQHRRAFAPGFCGPRL